MTEEEKKILFDHLITAVETFESYYCIKMKRKAYELVLIYLQEYDFDSTMDAIEIAASRYDDPVDALYKIGGILKNKSKLRQELFEEDNDD